MDEIMLLRQAELAERVSQEMKEKKIKEENLEKANWK